MLVKLVNAIMVGHDPALKIQLLDGFGSRQSREKFVSSAFSACVMDVVVGKVDLCIGDFWVTESRLSTGVQFLLPFGSDDFYVIAKTGGERIQLSVCRARLVLTSLRATLHSLFLGMLLLPDTQSTAEKLYAMLLAQWRPFAGSLWLCFFAFIFATSLVMFLTDGILDIGDEFEGARLSVRACVRAYVPACLHACVRTCMCPPDIHAHAKMYACKSSQPLFLNIL